MKISLRRNRVQHASITFACFILSTIVWQQAHTEPTSSAVIQIQPDTGEAGIAAALAKIKQLRHGSHSHGRIELHFARGTYRLTTPIVIDEEDCGSDSDGILLQGEPGVRITGTVAVEQLMKSSSVGVSVALIPQLQHLKEASFVPFSYDHTPSTMPPEVFTGGHRLRLSRWLSSGVATVSSKTLTQDGWALALNAANPPKTLAGPGAFALIRWNGDWDYSYERVTASSIAPVSITIPESNKMPMVGATTAIVFNPSSTIAADENYFLDVATGMLFVRSSKHLTQAIEVSIAEHLLSIRHGTSVEVAGIEWDGSRSEAITAEDSKHIRLVRITVRNAATTGIAISGSDNAIVDSLVEDVGGQGISLGGGNRQTLQSGNNSIVRSTIRRFGILMPTYRPGVTLFGVGNTIEDSTISDGPHAGLILYGNNHRVQRNVFRNLMQSSDDGGAVYTGRDWTERGTIIDNNVFSDIYGIRNHSAAVYLDDEESGIRVSHNHFRGVSIGVILGGGVDDAIVSNDFQNTKICIAVDNRGMNWQKNDVVDPLSSLRRHLTAVPFQGPLYSLQYPTLKNILEDSPGVPKRNVITANSCEAGLVYLPDGFETSNIVQPSPASR